MSNNHLNNTSAETFRHVRTNPITGESDYYYPLEITDSSIRALARERGLETGRTRLGNRVFEAAMIPCKDTAMIHGVEVFVDTPSDVQHRRYLEYIRDELTAQDAAKQDGRCQIPDGRGGVRRCPCRVPNPDYAPGGDKPKTIPVRCEGCKYEQLRHAHTIIELSCLDHESDDGEMETYEIPAPKNYYAADRYLKLREEFIVFVKERDSKLTSLAKLLADEFTKSEAARKLGDATSTVGNRTSRLKVLVTEFLDNVITL